MTLSSFAARSVANRVAYQPEGSALVIWASGGFTRSVDYTDSGGKQAMTSRAEIRQYATKSPFVEKISIFK